MASQNHIWSPYGVSINQDPFYDDGNSPEESFQNLMAQFSQHLDGKRVYILEKIGPDSFIMTYEWKVSAVSEREMHQVFTASQIEARFPHIWTQEVVETEKAYAAPLKRHGNIIGIIGFDKDPDKPHHDSSQSVRLLVFFVSTLLYNWKLIERLQVLGYTDPLTGVSNFNRLLSALDHLSDETSLGVIFADVSGLKKINDNYGLEAGNDLLTRVTGTLIQVFDKKQVFRVGGDEFIILDDGIKEASFLEKVREIRMLMASRSINLAVGVVWVPQFSMDFSVLKEKADRRMYEEKRAFYEKMGQEAPVYHQNSAEELSLRINCDTVPSPFFVFAVERDSVGAIKNIRIKVVNQAFADLFNMRPERWTNRSIMPLLKAPDQPLWAYIHKMANEKENVTFRIKSQFLQEEMLISMKMTSPYYGTLVMMPLGQKSQVPCL